MTYKYEILEQLLKYGKKDKNRLHIPGHKNNKDFRKVFPNAPIDVTELDFSDDLSCPDGVIKKAQEDLAEILGAKKTYITTDGSTSGIMAMVFVASQYGNKLIVPRNSHKSVFNACRVMNIEPVIVQGPEEAGIITAPPSDLIETLIVNDVNIAGMIVASPDYYGNVAPLEDYANILKKYDRFLFVDGAHGAHLALEEGRVNYAGRYADMWVDGVHKTLPTLTQGAIVCVNDDKLMNIADEAMNIFRTSSPSYPIMASVEYGVKYLLNNPRTLRKAKAAVLLLKSELSSFKLYLCADWTKLSIDFKPLNVDPELVAEQLRKKGIYPEMVSGRYIMFYFSPMTELSHINQLKNLLLKICSQKKLQGTFKGLPPVYDTDRTYSFLYAHKSKSELVPLEDAVGRMAADNAGIQPPSLPVIVAGEIITLQAIAVIKRARKTFGVTDGKIKVVVDYGSM